MPFINSQTLHTIENLAHNPPHGLLLYGEKGVGLKAAADTFIQSLDGTVQHVTAEKNSIGVERIRELYEQTKSKNERPRIILIDDAETLTQTAQGAFLKLLEEPTPNTHFVLLSHSLDSFLPTILSRLQKIKVQRITTEQSKVLLDDEHVADQTKRTQLLFIADGRPAELMRLIHDDDYFAAQASVVRDARTLVQGDAYAALRVCHKYKDDRETALTCLEAAMRVLRASTGGASKAKIIHTIERLLLAHEAIVRNGNIRLQMSAVVV